MTETKYYLKEDGLRTLAYAQEYDTKLGRATRDAVCIASRINQPGDTYYQARESMLEIINDSSIQLKDLYFN